MKDFFKNKTNILLLSMLVVLIGVAIYLIYSLVVPKGAVAIDFSNLTENEVLEWKAKEGIDDALFTIRYEYNEEVEKGHVAYQSIKAGESIGAGITIAISNGPDPNLEVELPSVDAMTKTSIKEWFDTNKFTNVVYEYVISETLEKDKVVALSKSGKVKRSDEIIVKISAGDNADGVKVTVPNFAEYTIEEISKWAEENFITVRYNHTVSSTYPDGKVIEQSVKPQTEVSVGEIITITISQGNGISVKDFYNSSRSAVDTWCKENNIKVSYSYVSSSKVKENLVVSTDPKAGTLIGSGDTLKVYLSEGEKEKEEKVTVDANHLKKSEEEFVKYITGLGLKANKGNVAYFSTTINAGLIYAYDDGEFKKGETINYYLSVGPYKFSGSEYNGKTKSQVSNLVNGYNERNAHITVKYNEVTSDKYQKDVVFDCKSSTSGKNTTVTCSLSKGSATTPSPSPSPTPTPDEKVTVKNYVGQSSPCGSNDACTIETINYKVTYQESEKYDKGVVISQDKSGELAKNSTVNLVVSSGVKMAYIGQKTIYSSSNNNYDEALDNIQRNLGVFTNLSIETTSDAPEANGQIVSISVGDYGEDYTPGNYPINTPIKVVISKK